MKDAAYFLANPDELAALLVNANPVEHQFACAVIANPVFQAWLQQQIAVATQYCLGIEHP